MEAFKPLIAKVAAGAELSRAEAFDAFEAMLSGDVTPAQIGGFLMALRVRGEAVEEITGAVAAMRAFWRWRCLLRSSNTGSTMTVGNGIRCSRDTAPPWVRVSWPCWSSSARSRRTVISETPNIAARSALDMKPRVRIISAIRSLRMRPNRRLLSSACCSLMLILRQSSCVLCRPCCGRGVRQSNKFARARASAAPGAALSDATPCLMVPRPQRTEWHASGLADHRGASAR